MTTAIVNNMLRCDNCSFEAKSIVGLARHVKHKHGFILSTAKNTCTFCKKVFSSSASCTRHIITKVCIPRTNDTAVSIEEPTQIEVNEIKETTETKETTEIKELRSHPIHLEEFYITKNPQPFGSIFVKTILCSIFFIPLYKRLRHIS